MRALTLRQLRSVQAIHRHGTIAAAARALGLTAPAVTLQIKQVEEECGLLLFDRTSEGMRLTAAGRAALEAADSVETTLRRMRDSFDAIKGVKAGSIRLGVVSTAKYFAPRLIAAFRALHPDITIKLVVGNRSSIVEDLRAYQLDMALMGQAPAEFPVESALVGDHPLVMIAAPEHPLAGRRDIGREALLTETIIIREAGSGTRSSLEAFFSGIEGAMTRNTAEMGSNETIKQAVMAGLGIAFISAHTIAAEIEMRRLAVLDVVGLPIRRQWFTVWRRERVPAPAERAFIDFLGAKGALYLPHLDRLYPEAALAAGGPDAEAKRR